MKSKINIYVILTLFFTFVVWLILSADLDHDNIVMTIGHSVPHGDKIGHFLIFGIGALLLNMALSFRQVKISFRHFHLGSIIVFSFAICEEFTQIFFDTRNFDFVDMLFDLIGIGVFSSISFRKYLIRQLRSLTKYLSQAMLVD